MNNTKEIGGITFTAVRFSKPCPHWRVKLPNGVVMGSGVFDGRSRPKLFASIEDSFERCCRHHGANHWAYSVGLADRPK